MLMIILDGTIVTVALPLSSVTSAFPRPGWPRVVNAYLIAFGGLLLLAGRLGDLIGGKRSSWPAGRLHRGLAAVRPVGEPADADRGRFVQGPAARWPRRQPGYDRQAVPEAAAARRALGVYSFTGAGGAFGRLVLGGVLTQALSWHWIFFVNAPVGAVAVTRVFAAGGERRPARRAPGSAGLRLCGCLRVCGGRRCSRGTAGDGGADDRVYTIVETSGYGWGSARTLGTGVIAAVLLTAFFVPAAPRAARRCFPSGFSGPAMSSGRTSCRRSRGGGVRVPGADPQ